MNKAEKIKHTKIENRARSASEVSRSSLFALRVALLLVVLVLLLLLLLLVLVSVFHYAAVAAVSLFGYPLRLPLHFNDTI